MKSVISFSVELRYLLSPKEYIVWRNDLIGKYIDALAFSTLATNLSSKDVERIIILKYADKRLNVFVLNMMSDSCIVDEIQIGYFALNGKFHNL